jgi:excisionase family DNA binding protein
LTTATKHLLTVREAAEFAGVHEDTVHRWIRDEGLPKIQPAGPHTAIRIDPIDLDRFLNRDSHERLAARVRTAATRLGGMAERTA